MPVIFGLIVFGIVIFALIDLYKALSVNDPGSLMGMAIWIALPTIVSWSVGANFGANYGTAAAAIALVVMLVWCCIRTTQSDFKIMMMSGIRVPANLIAAVCLTVPGVRLVYGVMSGELKREGWEGLPIEWMLSLAYPGVAALAVSVIIGRIYKFSNDRIEEDERRVFQQRFEQQNYEHREQRQDRDRTQRASENHDDFRSRERSCDDEVRPWWIELGVEPTASEEEVKRAARELQKTYHPDKMANHPRFRDEAERLLKIINAALANALRDIRARKHE